VTSADRLLDLASPVSAPSHGPAPASPTLVIQPSGRIPRIDVRELWSYRGLFFFLVWRDIKIRYAQTLLGAGWAIMQPLLTTLIFTVVFGRMAKVPSDGVPYPVFALAALVPWTYFAAALTSASNSLVTNTNLITKVYFPRLVIPFTAVLSGLVDVAVSFVILLLALGYYQIVPSPWALLVVPLLLGAMLLVTAGLGCWLAALNIQYRDVRYLVPFLLQAWLYLSPVVYPASLVPDRYRTLYALNPMVGVIEGFRASLLGRSALPWSAIGMSVGIGVLLFVSGALYFRRTEPVFADVA